MFIFVVYLPLKVFQPNTLNICYTNLKESHKIYQKIQDQHSKINIFTLDLHFTAILVIIFFIAPVIKKIKLFAYFTLIYVFKKK